MGRFKYIKKVKTASGKWRYIYASKNSPSPTDFGEAITNQAYAKTHPETQKYIKGSNKGDAMLRANPHVPSSTKKIWRDLDRSSNVYARNMLKYSKTPMGEALRTARPYKKTCDKIIRAFRFLRYGVESVKDVYDVYKAAEKIIRG